MGKNIAITPQQGYQRASVEYAPSGAARCRHCDGKIKLGTLRVIYGGGKYVHVRCWKAPQGVVLDDNYFQPGYQVVLKDEDKQRLADYIEKNNAKVRKKREADQIPTLTEKAVSVSSIPPAPTMDNNRASDDTFAFGKITTDAFTLIMSFLSPSELGRVERVCKAFLRAADRSWQVRYAALEIGPFDSSKFATAKLAYLYGTCLGCVQKLDGNPTFIKAVKRSVCSKCIASNPDFKYVAKKYLKDYGLSEADIKKYKIPYETRPNPYGRNLAPMKCFLVYKLKEIAKIKHQPKEASEEPKKKKSRR